MQDDAVVLPAPVVAPLSARLRAGVREPAAWLQLLCFGIVGASGYAINLAVFAAAVHGAAMHYRVAALLAFAVAVSNNFLWNRRWTFPGAGAPAHRQAVRFLVVSGAAFLVGLLVLTLRVEAVGVAELPAQAASIVAVTPLSFLANKLWSFRR